MATFRLQHKFGHSRHVVSATLYLSKPVRHGPRPLGLLVRTRARLLKKQYFGDVEHRCRSPRHRGVVGAEISSPSCSSWP
jgi:hypothetical protein